GSLEMEQPADLDLGAAPAPAAASPAPVFSAAPAAAAPNEELEQTRREMARLRQQAKTALIGVAVLAVLGIGLSLRPRSAPKAAPAGTGGSGEPFRAAAQAAPGAPAEPLHPPTLADQALKLVQDRPVGRDGTVRSRLALMTPPGAPLPEEARWRVGLCEGRGCDVSYSAGLVDPATGAELLYLFHADTGRREVGGQNEPARILLKKR
ncbi:MAG: hypothetical protein HY925_06765, partial [Elusimicrobia bacterium]|nr:hypothetical protein [Elusimicrobiota bacterium]